LRKELKHFFRCHFMTTNDNDFKQKNAPRFFCNFCDYGTCKKSSFESHLATRKHFLTTKNNAFQAVSSQPKYTCENCEKGFNDRAGLWRHKKKCLESNTLATYTPDIIQLITELVKSNTEMQQSMMELGKQNAITNQSHNTTHINSHNKSFNLQFFLNETCKDAMNIMDFADSIKLQLSDLEKVGEVGYVEGISNIIVKNLNALDVTKRPIHCTDKKREVLYVKDEDKWEKEDSEKNKIKRVIKKVAYKNSSLLRVFREKNPEYKNGESKVSEKYDKLVIEAMGGGGNNEMAKQEKIIKNIARVVSIEKGSE